MVSTITKYLPNAVEGHSYGCPALKVEDRPIIGMGYSKKHGLSVYPFDIRVLSALHTEFAGFEHGKGYIRFSSDNPIPDALLTLCIDLRLELLDLKAD